MRSEWGGTCSERSTSVDVSFICEHHGDAVARSDLSEDCAFRNVLHRHSSRSGFQRVQTAIVSLSSSHSSQSALVVDTPGQDLVVVGEGDSVHSTGGKLDNADIFGREEAIEARSLYVGDGWWSLCAKPQLSRRSLSKDKNVELLDRRLVDGDLGLGFGISLWCSTRLLRRRFLLVLLLLLVPPLPALALGCAGGCGGAGAGRTRHLSFRARGGSGRLCSGLCLALWCCFGRALGSRFCCTSWCACCKFVSN